MSNIITFLENQGYNKIPFHIRKSNHLYLNARINSVKGLFLLDTGASTTCIDLQEQSLFYLNSSQSNTKASGAGSNDLYTEVSTGNQIQLGKWKSNNNTFVLLDLAHVNIALDQYGLPKVQGIIGSDLLKKHHAIIDYSSRLLFIR